MSSLPFFFNPYGSTIMQFSSDDYFNIGHEHVLKGKPCQDHALSGVLEGAAYAIVADGCSKGGLTDVGARFMSLSVASAIREHWGRGRTNISPNAPEEVAIEQRIILGGVKEAFRLARDDMLATCVYAYVSEQGGFVHVRGDGVVAIVGQSGEVRLYRYDWQNSTPFYPAYVEDNYASFTASHGGVSNITALKCQEWKAEEDGEFEQVSDTSYSVAAGIAGIIIPISAELLATTAFVAVFTDGVQQVDGYDWKEVVRELLAFKNLNGEFAKRRIIRFIKDSTKNGKGPLDDIAYAVIRVTSDAEEEQADGS